MGYSLRKHLGLRVLAWELGWWLPGPPRVKRWLMRQIGGRTSSGEWISPSELGSKDEV